MFSEEIQADYYIELYNNSMSMKSLVLNLLWNLYQYWIRVVLCLTSGVNSELETKQGSWNIDEYKYNFLKDILYLARLKDETSLKWELE